MRFYARAADKPVKRVIRGNSTFTCERWKRVKRVIQNPSSLPLRGSAVLV